MIRCLIVLLFVSHAYGAQVVVPAHLQYLNASSAGQFDSPDALAFAMFLDVMSDQNLEIIYHDQQSVAQKQLYSGEAVASLFLSEQTEDTPLSDHFLYSDPVIESGFWQYGLFGCREFDKPSPSKITVLSTQTHLIQSIQSQYDASLIIENSWTNVINHCVKDHALIALPLSMNGQKIMGHSVYWTQDIVKLSQSFHVIFSSQHPKGEKLKQLFNNRLIDNKKYKQRIPK